VLRVHRRCGWRRRRSSCVVGNGDKEKADSFNCGCKSAVVMLNARVRFGEGAAEAVFDINCGAHIRRGASTCARSRTCAGSVIRASE
jgi:gamma-glutamyl phosphate reductase